MTDKPPRLYGHSSTRSWWYPRAVRAGHVAHAVAARDASAMREKRMDWPTIIFAAIVILLLLAIVRPAFD